MSPARAKPVVVLGIDAADPGLVRRLAGSGRLPHIRSLLQRGLVARSRSLDGFYVGSTWPSLYTGLSPAKHGLHYLRQLVPGTYRFQRMAEGDFVRGVPVWSTLGRNGLRTAILDVPLSRLDPAVNGIQVVEWGGHDAVFGYRATPSEVESQIRERHGLHPAGSRCDGIRRRGEDYLPFVAALEAGARRKGTLTAELIRREPWDLVMQVFTESHCAGHQCWHLHDPAHPAYDPAVTALTGDPLERTYIAIDSAIGEILVAAGSDAFVLFVIAHGMSYRFGASFLLPEILMRLGVTERPSALASWKRKLMSRWNRPSTTALPPHYQRSRCFPVSNGLAAGGVRLNTRGREPAGRLSPGDQVEEFCRTLSADLAGIIDQRTGRPLVHRVLRTSQLYQGDQLDALPDLLVEWSDEVPTGSTAVGGGSGSTVRASSPKMGMVEGTNDYGRTGEHRAEGMLVAAGGNLKSGQLTREVSVLDVAPTIAALFGVTLPNSDGRVIAEMVPPVAPAR
jgi:predicted AlkP superfamily phosphohydrolase/phosphomutase